MDKQVPVIELEIGEEKKKVEVYKWLTLEESTEYSDMALGDSDITKEKEINDRVLTAKLYGKLNEFLIKKMCKSPSWEIVNCWKPSEREELVEKLRELLEKN